MTNLYMKVGVLAENNPTYKNELQKEKCIRGTKRIGVSWDEIQSKCRERRIVDAKKICCHYLRTEGWTLAKIADFVGLDNHATIHHHYMSANELIEYDTPFEIKYNKFIKA